MAKHNLKPVALPGTSIQYGVKNYFLHQYIHDFQNRMVSVPVTVQKSLFVFDFQYLLKNKYNIDATEERISQLIYLIAATQNKLDDKSLIKSMKEMGLFPASSERESPDDKKGKRDDTFSPERIIQDIKQSVVNQMTKSGISTLLYRDIFNSKESERISVGELKIADVVHGIGKCKALYGKFIDSEPSMDVATFLRDSVLTSPIVKFISGLMDITTSTNHPLIQVKMSHVIDQVFKTTYGREYVTINPIFPGKCYKLDDIMVPDITFADSLGATVLGVRMMMGLPIDISESQINLSSLVEQQVTGIGQLLPQMHAEIGTVDPNHISDFMVREMVKRIIVRVMTGDFGFYESRINNTIERKKYTRDDAVDHIIRKGIQCSSIFMESFFDVIATFKFFATDDTVYFPEINPLKKKQIREFTTKFMDQFSQFSLPLGHPNYYSEPAHVIGHKVDFQASLPEFVMTDNDYDKAPQFVLGDNQDATLRLYSSGVTSGDFFDIEDLKYSQRLLKHASKYEPLYRFNVIYENPVLQSDLVRHAFNLIPLSQIITLPFANDLLSRGRLEYFSSASDMSFKMHLPIEVADMIFEKGKNDFYLNLTDSSAVTFYMDSRVFDIFMVKPMGDFQYLPSFSMRWPGVLEDMESTFFMQRPGTIETVITKGTDPNANNTKNQSKNTQAPDPNQGTDDKGTSNPDTNISASTDEDPK
jgi:hypothetical protein